LLRL
jgi:hypothetical protein